FKFIFSEAFTSPDLAEALRCLPCRWMRIIGKAVSLATPNLKKSHQKRLFDYKANNVAQKRAKHPLSRLIRWGK
ncbi:hypothetical protein, partial [Vibrio vulnificus]|uniref:hypothetical protein n=2 Tax=Vibrio vulnificus TaxID=672 RepID=UPI001C318E08